MGIPLLSEKMVIDRKSYKSSGFGFQSKSSFWRRFKSFVISGSGAFVSRFRVTETYMLRSSNVETVFTWSLMEFRKWYAQNKYVWVECKTDAGKKLYNVNLDR